MRYTQLNEEKCMLEKPKSSRAGYSNRLFLIGTMALIGLLTIIKAINEPAPISLPQTHVYSPRFKMESVLGTRPTHKFRVQRTLVTNKQFYSFVVATGYRSMREEQLVWPNWEHPGAVSEQNAQTPSWKENPKKPAIWLTRHDAEAFCLWLSHRSGMPSPYTTRDGSLPWQHEGFRLPSVDELEHSEKISSSTWEWTLNDLSHFDSNLLNAKQYLTAYKLNTPLHHRRHEDLTRNDAKPIAFRVAWTVFE